MTHAIPNRARLPLLAWILIGIALATGITGAVIGGLAYANSSSGTSVAAVAAAPARVQIGAPTDGMPVDSANEVCQVAEQSHLANFVKGTSAKPDPDTPACNVENAADYGIRLSATNTNEIGNTPYGQYTYDYGVNLRATQGPHSYEHSFQLKALPGTSYAYIVYANFGTSYTLDWVTTDKQFEFTLLILPKPGTIVRSTPAQMVAAIDNLVEIPGK